LDYNEEINTDVDKDIFTRLWTLRKEISKQEKQYYEWVKVLLEAKKKNVEMQDKINSLWDNIESVEEVVKGERDVSDWESEDLDPNEVN